MRLSSNTLVARYLTAALAVALAFALRMALHPVLGEHSPFLAFTLAVMVAAWRGGLGPGLLATALSAALGSYFYLATTSGGQFRQDHVTSLALFIAVGAVSSSLGEAMRFAHWRANSSAMTAAQHLDAALINERRLGDILASAMDAIISVDEKQRVVLFNPAAEAMFGTTAAEMFGHTLDRFIPERFRAAHGGFMERFGETGSTTRAMGRLGTLHALRSDGKEFPIEATISHTATADGRLFTVFIRDVTDRQRAEEELRRRAEELVQANRSKDEFLAMLGHELRNPLSPMLNALELMRLRRHDAEGVARAHAILERQARHMARLVDDLLDVSRITRNKVELRRERLDLRGPLEQALQTVRPAIEQREHRLEVCLPDTPVIIDADPDRMEQVFLNLLNNAVKFTRPGGEITVDLCAQDEAAVFRVRDTGVGIPADVLPRIFDLFTQADHSLDRSLGGLGIGLTLVKQLVEMQGGTVEARSDGSDRGSEFTVRLPLAAALEDSAQGPAANGQTHGQKTRRILVVDDNVDAARMLEDVLKTLGHEVRVAHDGPTALEEVSRYHPDVVLLDIGLPGMDGYEVVRVLRRMPELPRMRVVAVTGYGQDEDRRRSEEAGFDAHLVKPVDLDLLERQLSA